MMSVFPLTHILIVTYGSCLVLKGLKISQTEHRAKDDYTVDRLIDISVPAS